MLVNPGDLIPVVPSATALPWTRRKSQILNYLHRGPVTFSTLVYDTNVGDISAIATYFNPQRVSIHDLNSRFGHYPESGNLSGDVAVQDTGVPQNALSVRPRLLLYPDHNLNHKQVTVQRTLKWVLSQDGKQSTGSSRSATPHDDMISPLVPSEIPVPHSPRLNPLHATAPANLASQLDNVWGVVGEGRSRGVSRGSGDMARSRGSSADWTFRAEVNSGIEEPLVPRWDIGEEPLKWDIGEGVKGDKTWATWGSNQLFENLFKGNRPQ